MKKFLKSLGLLMVAGALTLTLASCNSQGKLIMATNAEFPPFEFVTEEGKGIVDKYDGIDVVVAKEIADKMGKELEISNMVFDSIIPALISGKADIAVAGMSINEERLKNVDFSDPYWVAVQTIIVKQENTDITKVDDLKGKTVGVVTGYTGDLALSEVEGVTLKRYIKGVDIVLDVKNGKIDAGVIDSPTAGNFIKKNTEIKGIEDEEFFETEEYAIAVKKGDAETLKVVNQVIAEMKSSGKIDEISAQVDARLAGAEQ